MPGRSSSATLTIDGLAFLDKAANYFEGRRPIPLFLQSCGRAAMRHSQNPATRALLTAAIAKPIASHDPVHRRGGPRPGPHAEVIECNGDQRPPGAMPSTNRTRFPS